MKTRKSVKQKGLSQKETVTPVNISIAPRPAFVRLDALGGLIKQIREENKLTQADLAEILEIDNTYVSKMECNLKTQRLDTIIKVIHALNGRLIIRLPAEGGMKDIELV
jgi:DNA-binding XRE family transcriptional regulator